MSSLAFESALMMNARRFTTRVCRPEWVTSLQELHEVHETPPSFADMFSGRLSIVGDRVVKT